MLIPAFFKVRLLLPVQSAHDRCAFSGKRYAGGCYYKHRAGRGNSEFKYFHGSPYWWVHACSPSIFYKNPDLNLLLVRSQPVRRSSQEGVRRILVYDILQDVFGNSALLGYSWNLIIASGETYVRIESACEEVTRSTGNRIVLFGSADFNALMRPIYLIYQSGVSWPYIRTWRAWMRLYWGEVAEDTSP